MLQISPVTSSRAWGGSFFVLISVFLATPPTPTLNISHCSSFWETTKQLCIPPLLCLIEYNFSKKNNNSISPFLLHKPALDSWTQAFCFLLRISNDSSESRHWPWSNLQMKSTPDCEGFPSLLVLPVLVVILIGASREK